MKITFKGKGPRKQYYMNCRDDQKYIVRTKTLSQDLRLLCVFICRERRKFRKTAPGFTKGMGDPVQGVPKFLMWFRKMVYPGSQNRGAGNLGRGTGQQSGRQSPCDILLTVTGRGRQEVDIGEVSI